MKKSSIIIALSMMITLLFSCSSAPDVAQQLNERAYSFHYSSLDSVSVYADSAYQSSFSDDDRAEALNHKAFVLLQKMQYDEAELLLDTVNMLTDNQVELLVSDVQRMRIYQRRSLNKEFYDARQSALQRILRIDEDKEMLDAHLRHRLIYARSEFHMVSSAYFYYVSFTAEQESEMDMIDADELRRYDQQQYLAYLYYAKGVNTEMCISVSRNTPYIYWLANSLQDHALIIMSHSPGQALSEALLATDLFATYGDTYQLSGTMVTLSKCYFELGHYEEALKVLNQSIEDHPSIMHAPGILSTIYEQLSITWAALGDKSKSDEYRNNYLDLHDQTRQDKFLESRADMYRQASKQLDYTLYFLIAAIVVLVLALLLFSHLSRKEKPNAELMKIQDELDETIEEQEVMRHKLRQSIQQFEDNRAKVSQLMALSPLIGRMHNAAQRGDMNDYVSELVDKIEGDNDFLTNWIQLRKGSLNVVVESFELQQLFDIISRTSGSMSLKGITLHVNQTEAVVKADKMLTLFMLNTLCDNARRYTPDGGTITVSAHSTDDYVEVSVSDTGCGIEEDKLPAIFSHGIQHGHGFGLMNCKGIMEKYRKMSSIFSVCSINVESRVGEGSRFFFRLPKGIMRLLLVLFSMIIPSLSSAQDYDKASLYADSAYYSNIDATYGRTIIMADSCLKFISPDLHLIGNIEDVPLEVQWYRKSHAGNDSIKFAILLDVRNEAAVAALAQQNWTLYHYNNNVYTKLYHEMSADETLATYCADMQRTQHDRHVAIVLLLIVLFCIIPAWYGLYYRRRLHRRYRSINDLKDTYALESEVLRRLELEHSSLHVANNITENMLSTIKHETMYYPSRIRQLLRQGDHDQLCEVIAFYNELYSTLMEVLVHNADSTHLTESQLNELLQDTLKRVGDTPTQIDRAVITQIVRDLGELRHNHRAGVRFGDDGKIEVIGTPPDLPQGEEK